MNDVDVDPVLGRLNGYWATPEMTVEETLAWTETLTGPARITAGEAVTVIRAEAESGREWRLRPGEIVALVQALRRRRALENPRPAVDLERPELEEITEKKTREEWIADAKAKLRESRGPLAEDLAATLPEEEPEDDK